MMERRILILTSILLMVCALAFGYYSYAEASSDTVTVKIEYYYWDENTPDHKSEDTPFNPFVANMPKHSTAMSERCPTVQGYYPCDDEGKALSNPVMEIEFDEDKIYEVFYKPDNVPYSITLLTENLYNSEYSFAGQLTDKGKTNSMPKEFDSEYKIPELGNKTLENMFEGFKLMYHKSDRIAADGSTAFQCFYDRIKYHVYFDLGENGYGVDPIYAPYETPIGPSSVGKPIRHGYEFLGWEWKDKNGNWHNGLKEKIEENITYRAKWKPVVAVDCTIVYRNANLNDGSNNTKYSYWGRKTLKKLPDQILSLNDVINDYKGNKIGDNDQELLDFDYFEFDAEATKRLNKINTLKEDGDTFKVRGDGTTVITLYYKRKSYTLQFAYMRQPFVKEKTEIKVTEIDEDKEYIIAAAKHINDKSFLTSSSTTNPPEKTSITDKNERLILLKQSQSENADNIKWKFTKVEGKQENYYITASGGANDGKYLSIGVQTGTLTDEPVEFIVTFYNEKAIIKKDDNKNLYLNDKRDVGLRANGYSDNNPNTNLGSQWFIIDANSLEGGERYIPSPDNYQLNSLDGTGDGYDGNTPLLDENGDKIDVNPVPWKNTVSTLANCDLPKVSFFDENLNESDIPYDDIPSNVLLKGKYIKEINGTKYLYHCIFLKAEYDSDLFINENDLKKSIWPVLSVEPVDEYTFGSWSTEYGSPYRKKYGKGTNGQKGHANIVGSFPTLSSDLIIDPSKKCAETMYAWWGDSASNVAPHAFEIYYENITEKEGISFGDVSVNKKQYTDIDFNLDRIDILNCAHNLGTRIDPFVIKGFSVIDSEVQGYSQSHNINNVTAHQKKDQVVGKDAEGNDIIGNIWTTEFHYVRNRHSITFYNNSANQYTPDNTDRSSIPYEQSLKYYKPQYANDAHTPPYPTNLNAGTFEFDGWYTSDLFLPDEKIIWEDIKDDQGNIITPATIMPDNDLSLYAYWKPKTFTVEYYNNKSDFENNKPYKDSRVHVYGTKIDEIENQEVKEKLDAYVFETAAGLVEAQPEDWYYYDKKGNLCAFDTDTMIISDNLKLFMRWSTNIPVDYTVHYYEANSTTPVAPDTFGHSMVGLTRTLDAKTGNQLFLIQNDDKNRYRTNWFPDRRSTSILMYPELEQNVQTFYYYYRDKVPYKVRYVKLLDDGTQEVETEEHLDNIYAAVTEKYKPYPGWIPSDYYINLILTISTKETVEEQKEEELEMNVITFYYTQDKDNLPYHIKYYQETDESEASIVNGNTVSETIDGIKYYFKETNYIDSIGEKNTSCTAPLITYTGYHAAISKELTYKMQYGNEICEIGTPVPIEAGKNSITFKLNSGITGKQVNIYYIKNKYPVKTVYRLDSNNKQAIKRWYNEMKPLLRDEFLKSDPIEVDGETVYSSFYKITESLYNKRYSETAPQTPNGYRLSGSQTQEILVIDDTTEDIHRNRITFEYTIKDEIIYYYYAVRPTENGYEFFDNSEEPKLLNINMETVLRGTRPQTSVTARISTDLYEFKGWYYDKSCTSKVLNGDGNLNNVISGEKSEQLLPPSSNVDQIYYAKYDYIRGDLEIKLTGVPKTDSIQYFEYRIEGTDPHNSWIDIKVIIPENDSKTITMLPIGNYKITQTDWAWRYDKNDPLIQSVYVEKDIKKAVTFTPYMTNTKWLDGNTCKDNIFH